MKRTVICEYVGRQSRQGGRPNQRRLERQGLRKGLKKKTHQCKVEFNFGNKESQFH